MHSLNEEDMDEMAKIEREEVKGDEEEEELKINTGYENTEIK
jgi:hypothetical protein